MKKALALFLAGGGGPPSWPAGPGRPSHRNHPRRGAPPQTTTGSAWGETGAGEVGPTGRGGGSLSAQADALMEVDAGTSDAAIIDLLMAATMTGEGTSYP